MMKRKDLIHLRPHTSDGAVFREVWLDERYDVACPVEPTTILDLGAHIGLTSRWFSERYPDADIISVEPHPDSAALCVANAPRAVVHNCAIAGTDGEAELWLPQGGSKYSCATIEDTDPSFVRNEEQVGRVTTRTIDSILDGRVAEIVKMDIEGSERAVFEAGGAWLDGVRLLLIETHDRFVPGCTDAVKAALNATGRAHTWDRLGSGPNYVITFEGDHE